MTTKAKTVTKSKAIRRPARELMAERKRLTIGAAYVSGVIGGFQRDTEKMVRHAAALKIGKISELRKLSVDTLRTKLATKIESTPADQMPTSIAIG